VTKLLALAAVPVCLMLALTAPASGARGSVSEATSAGASVRLLLRASETSGRVAVDSSPFHNNGVFKGGVGRLDGAYRFHPGYPRDRIRVEDHPSLSPGRRAFAFGADVRVHPNAFWEHPEMAVVRHGDSDTRGGDYKLEIEQTARGAVVATCVMHDGVGGFGYVKGDGPLATIDDGLWHRITCSRAPSAATVSLTIDGVTTTRADHKLGSIVGFDPVLIGVQLRRDGVRLREQFVGRMDNIRIAVGPRPLRGP
jgi:hypothetical protein